jgi:MOSC domain-containing protein YiiM
MTEAKQSRATTWASIAKSNVPHETAKSGVPHESTKAGASHESTKADTSEVKKGVVVALFDHPKKSYKKHEDTLDMIPAKELKLVEGKGIEGSRYFGKSCHLTAIETEVIAIYSKAIEKPIVPGQVRSNVEISGLPVTELLYEHGPLLVKIGATAIVKVYAQRVPCWKMDRICDGLQNLMWGKSATINKKEVHTFGYLNQGVKMKVVAGGIIKVGDIIVVNDA